MMLDAYEKDLFYSLENSIPAYKWYNINDKRPDRERFVETIKKRIDYYNDCEFNEDYTKFRRTKAYKTPKFNEITYTIEYKEQDYELNEVEKNLEAVKPKNISKEDMKRIQSRRTDV